MLYYSKLYHSALCYPVRYIIVLHYTMLLFIMLCCFIYYSKNYNRYSTIPYCTILRYTVPYILYDTMLYCTVLEWAMLYCTVAYNAIVYHIWICNTNNLSQCASVCCRSYMHNYSHPQPWLLIPNIIEYSITYHSIA